jgi:hypothetical protein
MKYFVSNQPEKLFSFLDNVLVAVGHLFYLLERFSQHVCDITGDHALFGVVDCSQVAGCPVQENSGNGSGFGLQQLEEQEKALTNLFTGIRTKEASDYEVTIVPFDNLDKEVLFRFSPQLGIVDADDLGGAPVYMNLKAIDRAPALDPKEADKKEKSLKGIIYNVPGKASIEISMNKKTLYKGKALITQFDTRKGLAPVMFEDKKAPVKIYFYPETGAIKQIIQ